MNDSDNKTIVVDIYRYSALWRILFSLALIAVILWAITKTGTIIAYFAIAGAIAYVLNPAVELMAEKKIPRGLSIAILFLIFVGIITGAIVFLGPPIARQFNALIDNMPQYFDTIKGLWEKGVALSKSREIPASFENLPQQVASELQNVVSQAATSLVTSVKGFFTGLAALVLIPILVYYFVKDGPNMKGALLKKIPFDYRDETNTLLGKINNALGGYVRGQLKLCLAMGVLTAVSLAFVPGMKYALVFGVIAGITEFIPYLGPILALIGPLIFATTVSWQMVIIVLVLFLIIQLVEGNVLAPRIIGNDVDMHPAFIILVLMAGGQIAGITGMIAAIPMAVILKVLFDHFYVGKIVLASEPGAAGAGTKPAPGAKSAPEKTPEEES